MNPRKTIRIFIMKSVLISFVLLVMIMLPFWGPTFLIAAVFVGPIIISVSFLVSIAVGEQAAKYFHNLGRLSSLVITVFAAGLCAVISYLIAITALEGGALLFMGMGAVYGVLFSLVYNYFSYSNITLKRALGT